MLLCVDWCYCVLIGGGVCVDWWCCAVNLTLRKLEAEENQLQDDGQAARAFEVAERGAMLSLFVFLFEFFSNSDVFISFALSPIASLTVRVCRTTTTTI